MKKDTKEMRKERVNNCIWGGSTMPFQRLGNDGFRIFKIKVSGVESKSSEVKRTTFHVPPSTKEII